MKLLGVRLGHDGNVSYYDGHKLYYIKSERVFNEKHHTLSISILENLIKHVWDINLSQIDDICIVNQWKPTNNQGILEHCYEQYGDHSVLKLHHHYAHALSSLDNTYDYSLVIDGHGNNRKCLTLFKGIEIVKEFSADDNGSIGLNMANLAKFIGCKAKYTEDYAGKLMGLQSYGDLDYEFLSKLKNYNMENINQIFDFDNWIEYKKSSQTALETKLNFAKTVHYKINQVIVDFLKTYANKTDRIFYSGGVAQNVIWNTTLKKEFPNLNILPHSSDEGLSLGGIEYLRIKHNLPKFILENFPYSQSDINVDIPSNTTIKTIAKFLSEGKIVAWYQGNGEIGPRALGNRSILMDPKIPNGKDKINAIKRRESYRPFGASILLEYKDEYFDLPFENEYMLYVAQVLNNKLPAITHVDNTCRIQTVGNSNPIFRNLLQEFYNLTGCPVLLNTSLNLAGNPIASSPKDALQEFNSTNIDYLVIGDNIFKK